MFDFDDYIVIKRNLFRGWLFDTCTYRIETQILITLWYRIIMVSVSGRRCISTHVRM